jgi:alkylation response protein AidB-like acyl-CoA dehydrogenase
MTKLEGGTTMTAALETETRDTVPNWKQIMEELGPAFASRAVEYDEQDGFVGTNFAELRKFRLFSSMVPPELGGGGLPYGEMSQLIQEIGRFCGSTALAFAMHQHLVAAAVFNYKRGRPGEKLLRAVAGGERVLVSTGANDWLSSSGSLQPAEGGFLFSARKSFASGCLAGDILVTSGQYEDPAEGWQVLHFPLSLKAQGVRIEETWKTMGMRGTGSHDVVIENAFVPADSISLRRPQGVYHAVWNVVLAVALPLISSAYVGIGQAARQIACRIAAKKDDGFTSLLLGEMENELTTAELALDSMRAIVTDLNFEANVENANRILIRKTLVTQAVIHAIEKALEATRGAGYFRSTGLERLLRDAYAGQFHPLQPKRQHQFTGRLAMGLDPIK